MPLFKLTAPEDATGSKEYTYPSSKCLRQVRWILMLFMLFYCSSLTSICGASRQRYCGKNLDNAMEKICTHGFNSYPVRSGAQKRRASGLSAELLDASQDYALDFADTAYAGGSFLAGLYGNRYMMQTRQRRGIIEQCCRNPCSFEDLAAYCRLED